MSKLAGLFCENKRFNLKLKPTYTLLNTLAFTPATTSNHCADKPLNFSAGTTSGASPKLTSNALTVGPSSGINLISSEIPEKYFLHPNYPNPFNPKTSINYDIRSAGFVSLKVYDAIGNEAAILVNERQGAGKYSVSFDAIGLPSGIYFYRLVTGSFVNTRKMVLVK